MKIKCEITEGKHKGLVMVSNPTDLFMGHTHKGGKTIPCGCSVDWYKVERWLVENKASKVEISIVDES